MHAKVYRKAKFHYRSSLHISLAKSVKLQAAMFPLDHSAPLVKSPPQYLLACNICPPELLFPQGQLTIASPPILVSGQKRISSRSFLPECDSMIVLSAGQPSYKHKKSNIN